jgi:tagatose 1,6-diphosphate aldolase GatY/KbaY
MIVSTRQLLTTAQKEGYAIGAFNVYNLEGVSAVIRGAETEQSPVILQVHPGAMKVGGKLLVSLCLAAAANANVPVGVHLDHSSSLTDIGAALDLGVPSIMADGSHLPYSDNVSFCKEAVAQARTHGAAVEVELGRLGGTEDGLTVSERNAKLTDPAQAVDFMDRTGADFLAVCIGNVHGHYSGEPVIDMDRLAEIRRLTNHPLVLHGASGLSTAIVRRTIELGVCKFNVNTEVREAYMGALSKVLASKDKPDLVDVMKAGISSMEPVVRAKLRDFGSSGRYEAVNEAVISHSAI